jgi:anti-sigma-K factor RskA
MIDHERIEERLVAHTLGGLDPIERAALEAELAEHAPGCDRCTTLLLEHRQVGAALAVSADPVTPPPGLEERVISAATGGVRTDRRAGAPRRLRAIVAGVAAAAILVAGSVATTLALSRRADAFRLVQLRGSGQGTISVAYLPGSERALVIGQGLPDLVGDRVYQLWVRHDGRFLGAGVFRPADGSFVAETDLSTSAFDLVAVTIEPPGGSPQPTSRPIASAPVQT